MAGIDSKDSLLGLTSLFYTPSTDVEVGTLLYPWQAQKMSRETNEIERVLEERCVEVRRLYEQNETTEEEKCQLEKEWVALVMEKDKNLRLQIEEENEKMKRFYMRQLHTMLESLGSFDFSKPNEVILRRNLAKIYQQVGKYCSKNNIEMTCNSKQVIGESVERFPRADELSLPPPPPPPPPPPLPVCTRIKETPVQLYKKRKVSSTKESDIPNKNCQQRTPLQCINEELMNRIRNSKLANLKSTPCKRSPGGTPMRRQRRLSESDTSDLITVALRRKFKNVALQSPNENGSPNVRSPAAEF